MAPTLASSSTRLPPLLGCAGKRWFAPESPILRTGGLKVASYKECVKGASYLGNQRAFATRVVQLGLFASATTGRLPLVLSSSDCLRRQPTGVHFNTCGWVRVCGCVCVGWGGGHFRFLIQMIPVPTPHARYCILLPSYGQVLQRGARQTLDRSVACCLYHCLAHV